MLKALSLSELNAHTFLQSEVWAYFKNDFGWEPFAFTYKDRGLLVLVKKLAPLIRMAYIPFGFDGYSALGISEVTELFSELKAALPPCSFIRWDIPWEALELPAKVHKAVSDIQPPDTVVLDLESSEEELLAAMKSKWRYNIRLAAKKGVTVQLGTDADLDAWYALYEETGKRDKIALHTKNYYKKVFSAFHKARDAKLLLYLATHEGDLLGGIFVVQYKTQAVYLYGASSNVKRNLMAAYALQWKAVCDAKDAGCCFYDFFGIPPEDDPQHPMHGLYRFKTGFGGTILQRKGSYDMPLQPLRYTLFRLAEKIRHWYFKQFRRR